MSRKMVSGGGLTFSQVEPPKPRERVNGQLKKHDSDDEYFTKIEDLEAELLLPEYVDYIREFVSNGGLIVLPADSCASSFYEFFCDNLETFGLRDGDERFLMIEYFDFENPYFLQQFENIANLYNGVIAITNPPFSICCLPPADTSTCLIRSVRVRCRPIRRSCCRTSSRR